MIKINSVFHIRRHIFATVKLVIDDTNKKGILEPTALNQINHGEKTFIDKIQYTWSASHTYKYLKQLDNFAAEICHPIQIRFDAVENEWKYRMKRRKELLSDFPFESDVVIIGGGLIGCAIAYWIKNIVPKGINVVVIEKDCNYTFNASKLSFGGFRQQFLMKEYIEMALFSSDFLRTCKYTMKSFCPDFFDLKFSPNGCLILADDESKALHLELCHKIQSQFGVHSELLTSDELKKRFSWLNSENVMLGSYGLEKEGWFNSFALLMNFKVKAISLGVRFVNGEVFGFMFGNMNFFYENEITELPRSVLVRLSDGSIKSINAAIFIFAAGYQSKILSEKIQIGKGIGLLRHSLPIGIKKRYNFALKCLDGPGINCPLLIDLDKFYFRREGLGGNFLYSCDSDKFSSLDYSIDNDSFDENIKSYLVKRIPAFYNIKPHFSWSILVDSNYFDGHPIIGPHPFFPNIYFATGFGHEGKQHAPAIGRAIAEYITDRKYKTIDLRHFHFDRIICNLKLPQ